ncbi:MAG: hypothetical protein EOO64_06240, partial [Massilia sp.]
MDLFLQFLVNGLVTGSFYALSALGLTLIFGLMRVVNFAHGEFYMLGGVLGWFVTSRLGLDFISGMLVVAHPLDQQAVHQPAEGGHRRRDHKHA